MKFEWNQAKADNNFKKHGIDFADVLLVFNDTNAITIADNDHDEERYVTLRMDAYGQLLVVVYTYRGTSAIRIISARQANKVERRYYEDLIYESSI